MLPRWLNSLFSKIPAAILPDTSSDLTKKAHSELVDNVLSDKPVEAAEETQFACPKCNKPGYSNQLCEHCLMTEMDTVLAGSTADNCVKCNHKLKKLTDGSYVCEDDNCECMCGTEMEKTSLVSALEKQAGAYELGDTEANTSAKGHEAQVKQASDYALAEMLTEKRLQGQGVQERWFEEFPKCLAEVKKDRKGCEKEMLDFVPLPAVIDRLNWLNEVMLKSHEKEFEATEAKNLYRPLFELDGKQTWDSAKNAWKEDWISAKEQYENQMPEEGGPGRDASDEMEHQAPLSATAGIHDLDNIQMIPQDRYLVYYHKIQGGERYYKWFHEQPDADNYIKETKEKGFALDPKMKDFSKEFAVKEGETLQKEAEISSPWVVVTEGDQDVIARITPDEILKKKSEDKVDRRASFFGHDLFITAEEILRFAAPPSADEIAKKLRTLPGMPPTGGIDDLPLDKQKLFVDNWEYGMNTALGMAYKQFGYGKMSPHEIGSSVFMAMRKALKYFDPNRDDAAKFKTVLYRTVHNQLIDDRYRFATETEQEKYKERQDKPHADIAPLTTPLGPGKENAPEDEGSVTLSDIVKDVTQKLPEEELEELQESKMREAIVRETIKRTREQLDGNAKKVFDLLAQGYNITQVAKMLGWTHSNASRYRKMIEAKVREIMEQVAAEVELEHGYVEKVPSPSKVEPELAYSPLPKKEKE